MGLICLFGIFSTPLPLSLPHLIVAQCDSDCVARDFRSTFTKTQYFYDMAKAAKSTKSEKKKYSASYRIDHDLYDKCMEKCYKLSYEKKEKITLSSVVEGLLKEWVAKK